MGDLISREQAIDAVDIGNLHRGIVEALQNIISELPSAEKTGKWINHKDEHRCSCCGEVVTGDWYYEDDAYSYCPNCGARMVNENE